MLVGTNFFICCERAREGASSSPAMERLSGFVMHSMWLHEVCKESSTIERLAGAETIGKSVAIAPERVSALCIARKN